MVTPYSFNSVFGAFYSKYFDTLTVCVLKKYPRLDYQNAQSVVDDILIEMLEKLPKGREEDWKEKLKFEYVLKSCMNKASQYAEKDKNRVGLDNIIAFGNKMQGIQDVYDEQPLDDMMLPMPVDTYPTEDENDEETEDEHDEETEDSMNDMSTCITDILWMTNEMYLEGDYDTKTRRRMKLIMEVMEKLPYKEKELIRGQYLSDESYAALAEELGYNNADVAKQTCCRAKMKIKKAVMKAESSLDSGSPLDLCA